MAAKTHTYRVQHDGQEFTRTTARTYTHLVLRRGAPSVGWFPLGWAGRLDLASKLVKQPTDVVVEVPAVQP